MYDLSYHHLGLSQRELFCYNIKMKKYIFGLGLAVFGTFNVSDASAYELVKQEAYKVTPSHSIYKLEFKLNVLNRDSFVPLLATPNPELAGVKYGFVNKSGEPLSIESQAIVLSNLPLSGRHYSLPMAQKGTFTLLVVAKNPTAESMVEINSIPLVFDVAEDNQGAVLSGLGLKPTGTNTIITK
jgi:hypothetical protein